MRIISKSSNRMQINDVFLYDINRTDDNNIVEAAVESLFEEYLFKCRWGKVNSMYTKRKAKNPAVDKFPSKTGKGNGAPDYILYESEKENSNIIAIGDVKKPNGSSAEEGLEDAKFYVEGYNSVHSNKIRIAFGYDAKDFKIKYLKDINKSTWEDIIIDDISLEVLPDPKFMNCIKDNGNEFTTTDIDKISKENLEPYFSECDKILRHSELSSSPVDKAIEVSIFIFLKIYSRKNLDISFKNEYGKSIWEYAENGNIEAVNEPFTNYLNKKYSNVFPKKLISLNKENTIQLARVINAMFDKYKIYELTDVKGNAMEYFQKDSKDRKIGEFFTPRHVVDLIIKLVNPEIQFKKDNDGKTVVDSNGRYKIDKIDKVYDPACGSGGFLIKVFDEYLHKYKSYGISSDDLKCDVLFGTELKEKTVLLTKLNMILLGDGHNNIIRSSAISYISAEKLTMVRENGKYMEVSKEDVDERVITFESGKIKKFYKKQTGEPVKQIFNKAKYYAAEIKDGKLIKKTTPKGYIKLKKTDVNISIDDEKKESYYSEKYKCPVIKFGDDCIKYYLAKYKKNKEGIPIKEYFQIKPVNEKVKNLHGDYFGKFDIVVSNHPYGLEEPTKPDELFIKHMIEAVKESGKIGCIVGENLLFDNNYKKFRKSIQEKYTVESIISLPQGVFLPYTDVKTSILFIKKEKSPKGHKTLMIDMKNDGFELNQTRKPTNANDINKIYRVWRKWGGIFTNFNGKEEYETYHKEESQFAELHTLNENNWCVKTYITSDVLSNNNLKAISLKDVLTRDKDVISIKDDKLYKRITIKTNCGGVIVRDEKMGKDIGTKRQFRVKEGQFIISKIDALNGAYGIVPKVADKAVITGNFWTYDIDKSKMIPEVLPLLLKNSNFEKEAYKLSYGTTNRQYLDEEEFLNYKIPMLSKLEQKRIYKELNSINKAYQLISASKERIEKIVNSEI